MKTATLVCAGCGAHLSFDEGQERASCFYCGAQSVLVSEQTGERPATRTVAGYAPAFFAAALSAAAPSALAERCSLYVENVKAYGDGQPHDEQMMRAIEETIDIPQEGKDEFRRGILNYIGALAIEGRSFEYGTSDKFHRALAAYLYLESGAAG